MECEPLELIAESATELTELVAFCRSADLEVVCVIVIAVEPDRRDAAEQGCAA